MIRLVWLCCICILVAACSESATGPQPDPIVLYVADDATLEYPALLRRFTEQTGISGSIRWGTSHELTEAVIGKSGIPADVLVTSSVADIWRAADAGALRPLTSTNLDDVPQQLRDPDGFWVASTWHRPLVVADPARGRMRINSYDDLAGEQVSGELCVVTSEEAWVQTMLAQLMTEMGEKPAERMARRWVRNLELPPFESETKVIDAVKDGRCRYGLILGRTAPESLQNTIPTPAAIEIEGVGVGRHARNAESAQAFVDWLIAETKLQYPANAMRHNVGAGGWLSEDAARLAERAGWN